MILIIYVLNSGKKRSLGRIDLRSFPVFPAYLDERSAVKQSMSTNAKNFFARTLFNSLIIPCVADLTNSALHGNLPYLVHSSSVLPRGSALPSSSDKRFYSTSLVRFPNLNFGRLHESVGEPDNYSTHLVVLAKGRF